MVYTQTDQRKGIVRHIVTAITGLALAVVLMATSRTTVEAREVGISNPTILPPSSSPYGKTYPEWVAAFWEYALEFPLEGHPFLDTPDFDFSARQSGHVWFWSAPDGPLTRTVTLPTGKALFLTLRDTECSSLETPDFDPDLGFGAHTATAQRDCAKFWADHIVDVFCVIDGVPVENLGAYRFVSPQFQFSAPTPWIFGDTGGVGTSVGDGYYLMLAPMSRGIHTIHYGGTFHFEAGEIGNEQPFDLPKDITIILNVH
jgi:hypothetical protein